jgi:hypothetical protein
MPVVIGREYLTIWGEPRMVCGYVRGGNGQPDPSRVWTAQGVHYHTDSGLCVMGGHPLVLLEPADERAYWVRRLAEIEGANSADRLALVAPGLERMRARIAELAHV